MLKHKELSEKIIAAAYAVHKADVPEWKKMFLR
jgi:hypothetical protein